MRIAVYSMLMEPEFETSKLTYDRIFGDLADDIHLFVLLNESESPEVSKYFENRDYVSYFSSPTNLGVAGGRRFLIDKIMAEGFEILISFDNDLLGPKNYFQKIAQRLTRLREGDKKVGVVAPALLNAKLIENFWQGKEGVVSIDKKEIVEFFPLSNFYNYRKRQLFYHTGVRNWVLHYFGIIIIFSNFLNKLIIKIFQIAGIKFSPFMEIFPITMLSESLAWVDKVYNHSDPELVTTLPGGAHCYFADLINECGTYSNDFNPFGYEDADFCLRVKKMGFRNYLLPEFFLIHDIDQRNNNRNPLYTSYITGRGRRLLLKNHGSFSVRVIGWFDSLLIYPLMNTVRGIYLFLKRGPKAKFGLTPPTIAFLSGFLLRKNYLK